MQVEGESPEVKNTQPITEVMEVITNLVLFLSYFFPFYPDNKNFHPDANFDVSFPHISFNAESDSSRLRK